MSKMFFVSSFSSWFAPEKDDAQNSETLFFTSYGWRPLFLPTALKPYVRFCVFSLCYATWSSLLRHLIFSATPLDLLCYTTWSSLLRHLIFSATPLDLHLHEDGWGGVGLGGWGGDDTTPVSCYLIFSATPLDLLCYATWSSLLRHLIFSATPLDLHLHEDGWGGVGLGGWGGDDTTPVSCYLIFSATPLDLLCYATWSSLTWGWVGWGGVGWVGWEWYYTCLLLLDLLCYATWSSLLRHLIFFASPLVFPFFWMLRK